MNLLQTDRRPALAITTVFFYGWLGILYAGADHPPPPGFALLVLIDLLAAAVVAWRVPTYVAWSRAQRPRRWLLALLEGAAAGLIVAGVVENNLSLGNMDFKDFAGAVDKDGVFRGFPSA